MYCVSTATVKEFEYENELMMKIHEDEMIADGWIVTKTVRNGYFGNQFIEDKLYREYRYHHLDGMFL